LGSLAPGGGGPSFERKSAELAACTVLLGKTKMALTNVSIKTVPIKTFMPGDCRCFIDVFFGNSTTFPVLKGMYYFSNSLQYNDKMCKPSVFILIAFEDLNLRGMVNKHHLVKRIADAGWRMLVQFTTYKAEWAGKEVKLVDPNNTVASLLGVRYGSPVLLSHGLNCNAAFHQRRYFYNFMTIINRLKIGKAFAILLT
jgi:IS605 OrfB family transposase